MLKTSMGRLRAVGFAEGVSFLLLLFIAMPLKYYGDTPEATQIVGMLHGILFLAYIFAVIPVRAEYNWTIKTTLLALVASVVPFGTFVADARIFRVQPK